MQEFHPLVSIVIPVYNGANYMREAINSALAQTYDNCEVLVINDGSNDNGETERIALSYGDRIRYFKKENGGVATALNMGIENMRGEYFSWLSHDDVYLPQKIEKQILSLMNYGTEKPVISVCNYSQIDETGKHIRDIIHNDRIMRSMRCFLAFDTDTGISGCAFLINKDLFKLCGEFDPEQKVTQDFDMWFRMASKAHFVFIGDKLMFQRIHDEQGGKKQYADIVLHVCDKLHAGFIAQLSLDEIVLFCGNNHKYLNDSYTCYNNAGYYRTATGILQILIKLSLFNGNKDHAAKLVKEHVLFGEIKDSYVFLESMGATNDKPRIVIYCHAWISGGIERVCATIMNKLYQKYDFIILVGQYGFTPGMYDLPDNVAFYQIQSNENILLRLFRAANLLNASIFIGNQNYNVDFLPIYSLFKDTSIKTIAWNHMYYFISKAMPGLYPLLVRRLKYLSDAAVSVWSTSFSANAYASFAGNAAVMHNPNTFEDVHISQPSKSDNILLCVARFDDYLKRIDRLLKTFRLVLNRIPEAKLMLVGKYDPNMILPDEGSITVSQLVKNLDFNKDDIVFVGETKNVSEYYEKAKLLLLTSSNEGFCLVLNEAAGHGVPSVIFEIPGLEDIIIDGVNGHIVYQDDMQGMADKIVMILNDKEHLHTLSENAAFYSERFNQSVICDRWDRLFKMLIATNCQNTINKHLSDEFMVAPEDMKTFVEKLSAEYQYVLNKFFDAYILQNMPNKTDIEYVHNTEYVYINNRHAFLKKFIRFAFRCVKKATEVLKIKNILKRSKLYQKMCVTGVMEKLNR